MRHPSIHAPLCPDTLARLIVATAAADQAAFAELYTSPAASCSASR